ncbi:MAG: CvpA family protein [Oscillospiraceae bacterium]|nr:CvpA family protein [Oscillospiraceae bacterium]
MDNALIIDGVIAVVLLAGLLIGAKRGLFKSLMGLLVVVLALIGSVMLADMLTEPITDFVAPKVEDAVVSQFSDALDRSMDSDGTDAQTGVSEMLERYGVSGDILKPLWDSAASSVFGAISAAKENTADVFRGSISASIRTLVSGAVHAVLVLVLYVVLLVVLKLLTRLLDHVFDLPVLSTANGLGGAAFGLLEAALLLYVAAYAASRLGVTFVTEHADDAYLLPIFLNRSPVELISSFTRKG